MVIQYDDKDNLLDGKKSFADILSSPWFSNLYKTIMAETWETCVFIVKKMTLKSHQRMERGAKISTL